MSTRISKGGTTGRDQPLAPIAASGHGRDRGGHTWETVAEPRPRIDVAGFFVNPALTATGFDARFDVSSLAGAYTVTIVAERGGSSWQCKLTQDLIIIGPGRATP